MLLVRPTASAPARDAATPDDTLGPRVEAAEAGLRNDALARPDALALLEAGLARVAGALGAAHGTAFIAAAGAPDEALVRCSVWPPDAPAEPAELDARGWSRTDPTLLPEAHFCTLWPDAMAVPVQGAADGVLLLCRRGAWTPAEQAAARRLGALFSTLWAWTEAEARFQRTVADLDDCLFTLGYDADGRRRYAFVTPPALALTGLAPDALLGGTADWAHLVAPEDRAAWDAHDAALRAGDASRVTIRLATPARTVWVCERATPGVDAAGRPTASGVLQDVTAEKEAEATMDRARRMAERAAATRMAFLRLMSHELRTPLGTIRGFAEVLADEVAALDGAPPEAAEFAGTIREAADRALRLVSSLLDLSRLETGALELSALPAYLARTAHAVAARYADRVAPGVALVVEAPSDAVALGDPSRVESVVDALVDNAVAFTSAGTIQISAALDGDRAVLTVRDTGVGMAADFAEALFEPFAQEDTRLARGHEGAGLSLAIAHRVAAQMGGTLTVQTALGAGSVFTLTLPAA